MGEWALLPTQHRRSFFRNLPPFIHLVIRVIFKFQRIYIFFSQQFQYTAVRPLFRLQVLNKATVIPARDYLLVQTTQVQPVIVTANPTKYRHIPSSLRERSDSARPSRLWKCGSWNEHTGGSHICWLKMRRTWCRDSGSQPKVWR